MTSPYVGQIMMFGGNFAPLNWALCNGQSMSISQQNTLFTLIGTTYGGDGSQSFNLPDMQGRIPVHMGQATGLSNYVIGQKGGVEQVTLTTQTTPAHTHTLSASTAPATATTVSNNVPGTVGTNMSFYVTPGTPPPTYHPLATSACTLAGGSQPHSNLMPSLCITFCISLVGIFPSQS
jgi:microcystin-dependent protein